MNEGLGFVWEVDEENVWASVYSGKIVWMGLGNG